MRILITGGFGFIGGCLAKYLSDSGHQILLGSRFSASVPDWLPQAEVMQMNWDDGNALEESCNGIDVVIHAAGMNAQECAADPVAALEFNGLATTRLLAASICAGVRRFIYISTAHIYASPLVGEITEDSCPRNLHPYATSHLAGENALLSVNQKGQIEGIVLRLSNAFGAPMHRDVNCWTLLVNDLCRQAIETRKLILQTSGFQQRDFIGMTDFCRFVDCIVSYDGNENLPSVFNVGAGVSKSVLEMAELIQKQCKLILGFEPTLQRATMGKDERHEQLSYHCDRLAKTGFCMALDDITEMNRLLLFCQSLFEQKKRSSL
ncbi:MAG: NAD-dependent epimerase/dehydratase family protein [Chlorobium sp.]